MKRTFLFLAVFVFLFVSHARAQDYVLPAQASANGKYSDLVQRLDCPKDAATYGEFNDYGYWAGGAWCGQKGKPGYWVWVAPTWYVWATKGEQVSVPGKASVQDKYSKLIQTLNCPEDASTYGEFNDYGYWAGGSWCGQTGRAGYWVWVAPNWYVWAVKNQ